MKLYGLLIPFSVAMKGRSELSTQINRSVTQICWQDKHFCVTSKCQIHLLYQYIWRAVVGRPVPLPLPLYVNQGHAVLSICSFLCICSFTSKFFDLPKRSLCIVAPLRKYRRRPACRLPKALSQKFLPTQPSLALFKNSTCRHLSIVLSTL